MQPVAAAHPLVDIEQVMLEVDRGLGEVGGVGGIGPRGVGICRTQAGEHGEDLRVLAPVLTSGIIGEEVARFTPISALDGFGEAGCVFAMKCSKSALACDLLQFCRLLEREEVLQIDERGSSVLRRGRPAHGPSGNPVHEQPTRGAFE